MRKTIVVLSAVAGSAAALAAGPVATGSAAPDLAAAGTCHWQQLEVYRRHNVSCATARHLVKLEYTKPAAAQRPWKCKSLPPDYAHGRCHKGSTKSFRWRQM